MHNAGLSRRCSRTKAQCQLYTAANLSTIKNVEKLIAIKMHQLQESACTYIQNLNVYLKKIILIILSFLKNKRLIQKCQRGNEIFYRLEKNSKL